MFDRQSIKWVTGLLIFLSMAWTLTLSAQSQIANPEREAKLKLRDERRAMAQKAQKSGNFATAIKAVTRPVPDPVLALTLALVWSPPRP